MEQHGLIANTTFRKPKKKLWIFMYPNDEKAKLDYILGGKKWTNSFKNCQSHNPFHTIGSNHRMVSCKVNISYRQSKPSPNVLCDNDLQNRYVVDVYNRYKALSEKMTQPITDDRYEALIVANANVAENILPKKRKRKGTDFETHDLIHVKNLLKSCAIKNRIKSTIGTRADLQSAKESLDQHIHKNSPD